MFQVSTPIIIFKQKACQRVRVIWIKTVENILVKTDEEKDKKETLKLKERPWSSLFFHTKMGQSFQLCFIIWFHPPPQRLF